MTRKAKSPADKKRVHLKVGVTGIDGNSPLINEKELDGTVSWYRPVDDMRVNPDPNKNREVHTPDEMSHISSGGVVDMVTKLPENKSMGSRHTYGKEIVPPKHQALGGKARTSPLV